MIAIECEITCIKNQPKYALKKSQAKAYALKCLNVYENKVRILRNDC